MTPGEFLVILAMIAYAVYRQSQTHEIVGAQRFKIAIIYGVVGLVVGGFNLPRNVVSVLFLVASVLLSLVVGQLRGRLQPIWRKDDGTAWTRGTPLTVGLFLGMIVVKFGLGTVAYLVHDADDGGIGETILMIAIMVALQAEVIWRRSQRIAPVSGGLPAEDVAPTNDARHFPARGVDAPVRPTSVPTKR